MDNAWRVRQRFISFVIPKRTLVVSGLLFIVSIAIFLASLSLGNSLISLPDVLTDLLGHANSDTHFIISSVRLPRVLMAIMVGAALAMSGLILQSMIRNPLASPDIIGITGGASAAAVGFLSFFATSMSIHWLPAFAIVGALIAALLIYSLAWQHGVTPMRLVLVGIGISAAMGAVTTLVIAISPQATSITAYTWLTGSVYGSGWRQVSALLPWLVFACPLVFFVARKVNAQELGDQVALGLGVPVQGMRFLLLLLSVALAAPAIAYAGAIGFVGLIAPHIARQLVDRSFASLLPVSAMVGACLVMLADLCGRTLFQPLDVPAGIFVSAIGAPFFIYLLYRQAF